jgi:hypothetical protein
MAFELFVAAALELVAHRAWWKHEHISARRTLGAVEAKDLDATSLFGRLLDRP